MVGSSYRQAKRSYTRYRAFGAKDWCMGNAAKPSNRARAGQERKRILWFENTTVAVRGSGSGGR